MTAKEFLYDWGGANVWLFQVINLHAPGRLDELMALVSRIGSFWNLPLVVGGWLVVANLLRRANCSMASPLLLQFRRLWIGAAIAFVITTSVKLAMDFPRPVVELAPSAVYVFEAGERGHSLPSGHASFSMLLAASLWPLIGAPSRLIVALFAFGVGLSRIWLGAHFPADVVAGYGVGLASAALAVVMSGRMRILKS